MLLGVHHEKSVSIVYHVLDSLTHDWVFGVQEQQSASKVWVEINFPGTVNPVAGGDRRRRGSVAWSSLEKRICNESVLWQRLRNSELVIQSKSLGTRRTEGGGSPCSQRRFEVRLQSCRVGRAGGFCSGLSPHFLNSESLLYFEHCPTGSVLEVL